VQLYEEANQTNLHSPLKLYFSLQKRRKKRVTMSMFSTVVVLVCYMWREITS